MGNLQKIKTENGNIYNVDDSWDVLNMFGLVKGEGLILDQPRGEERVTVVGIGYTGSVRQTQKILKVLVYKMTGDKKVYFAINNKMFVAGKVRHDPYKRA